jgi:hypothetical protein
LEKVGNDGMEKDEGYDLVHHQTGQDMLGDYERHDQSYTLQKPLENSILYSNLYGVPQIDFSWQKIEPDDVNSHHQSESSDGDIGDRVYDLNSLLQNR